MSDLVHNMQKIVRMHQRNQRKIKDSPYKYASYEDYVLDMGSNYPVQNLGCESSHVPTSRVRARPERECFRNCYTIALGDDEYWKQDGKTFFTYVEGYASSPRLGGVPIHHAWLVADCDCVYDPTWGKVMSVEELEQCEYIGVEFTEDDLRATALATGVFGVFYDHQNGHPLLIDGVPHGG